MRSLVLISGSDGEVTFEVKEPGTDVTSSDDVIKLVPGEVGAVVEWQGSLCEDMRYKPHYIIAEQTTDHKT